MVEMLKKGEFVAERVVREVCLKLNEILIEESNLVYLEGPVVVIGDVHGQFYDVLRIF